MADSVTDPLEKAVLSGAIFAGPDPDGPEPRRSLDSDDANSNSYQEDRGFVPPSDKVPFSNMNPTPSATVSKGKSYNTGVKGVLADYRESRQHSTSTNANQRPSGKNGSKANANKLLRARAKSHSLSSSSSLGDEVSDDERSAREAYRRKRLAEMQQMGSGERALLSHGGSKAKYGHLREVGQMQFVKATEEKSGVIVIIHVYDPSISACNTLNTHLSALARKYPYTKFLRAQSRELEFATGNEADVLPTLLVYRNGESVTSLVAFDKELQGQDADGHDDEDEDDTYSARVLTRQAVETALIEHGLLSRHAAVNINSSGDEDASD